MGESISRARMKEHQVGCWGAAGLLGGGVGDAGRFGDAEGLLGCWGVGLGC